MRSVRRLILTVAVSLYIPVFMVAASIPEQGSAMPSDLIVRVEESLEFHPRLDRINGLCRVSRDVVACTDFPRERFACHCEEGSDGWRIVVNAEVEAVIHLTAQRYLSHERLHLQDIEDELPIALAPFLVQRFTNAKPCQTLARVMSLPSFAVQVMNRIREGSNERLGCTKIGHSRSASASRRDE